MITEEEMNEQLIDQLQRLEGALGKYNCQHGGLKCNFQTNCHRLIRAEIDKIKEKENDSDDLSYEKDCPEAFGFDNYGSNNG